MTTTPLVGTAEDAVMIIHELNLQTRDKYAITEPAELARLLASLTALAAGLPQLLGQLDRWLTRQHAHQQLHAVGDRATSHLVEAIGRDLSQAARIAHDLTTILDSTHQNAADLSAPPALKDRSTTHQGVNFHP